MMKFLLMVNKQGQTRLAQYFDFKSIEERTALESEIIRKCLSRTEMQCSFMEHRGLKVVYRRYASLYFIVGFEEGEENELGMLEFIHALVETLDKYFENVVSAPPICAAACCCEAVSSMRAVLCAISQCELDIMFNLERAHFIVDEMVMNGCIVDTNRLSVLKPVALLDRIKA
jgi:AP-4 complex subunit sigma-1